MRTLSARGQEVGKNVSGVSAVKVDFDRKTATVTYDQDRARPEALSKATTNAGYPATMQKARPQ